LRDVVSEQADCLVSLGGGSMTGLGKARAPYRPSAGRDPTTYAGSEATPILGQTPKVAAGPPLAQLSAAADHHLRCRPQARPACAPFGGLRVKRDAHGVEALYAKDANPVTSMLADREIAGIAACASKDRSRQSRRFRAIGSGAWACGNCVGTVGMSLHHKLCRVLDGSFDLPPRRSR